MNKCRGFSIQTMPKWSEVVLKSKIPTNLFAEKVLTRELDRLFNLYLSKNDYMMDIKVADAMKMNEKEDQDE